MKIERPCFVAGILFVMIAGLNCGGGDSCVAAKVHMCERIPDMNCYAAFMDNAQTKIISACGQAELDAYIPVVQQACSAAQLSGTAMNCSDIAGKTYAAAADGGGKTCDAGAPMKFSYSGTATADGRSATLEFSISGSAVMAGTLHADPVCGTNIRLNRTDVSFTGSLSGVWESASGGISATWNGGDYACDGTALTPADGYPTNGSLTIAMVGGKVQLQRLISGAEPYEFTASNKVYTPPSATACATPDGSTKADAQGPVCSQLAACCPTITDVPALQSQCLQAVGNGMGESGCLVGLHDLQHVGYCSNADAAGLGGAPGSGGIMGTGGKSGAGGAGGFGGALGFGGAITTGKGGAFAVLDAGGVAGAPGSGGITGSSGLDASVRTDSATTSGLDASARTDSATTTDSPLATQETILFKVDSIQGVSYGPTAATVFTLAQASTITRIMTYHYASTIGTKSASVLLLNLTTQAVYGPWPMVGYKSFDGTLGAPRSSIGYVAGPPDNYWLAFPGAVVPAGTYQVVDSDSSTWAYAPDTAKRGIAQIYGY
jgi:hypothetical protein